MLNIKRTEKEVNDLLNETMEAEDSGTCRFPGMSYEQGITVGIEWLLGHIDEHPYPKG